MESSEQIYYKGYNRSNGYRQFYKQEGELYKEYVTADHRYMNVKTIDAFDLDGNYLGKHFKKDYFSKNETILSWVKSIFVVQIGYMFHLFQGQVFSTLEEMNDLQSTLNNSDLGKFSIDYNENFYRSVGLRRTKKLIEVSAKPIEVSAIGFSRCITRSSINDFFDLNPRDYLKNKNEFISKHPEFKVHVEALFTFNLNNLCNYLICTPKYLFSKKFNKSEQMVKRLMFKINNNDTSK